MMHACGMWCVFLVENNDFAEIGISTYPCTLWWEEEMWRTEFKKIF